MASEFKKPKKIQFEPERQESSDPAKSEDTPLKQEFQEKVVTTTKAEAVVEEYNRTVEFMKFLEKLLRDKSQVEVEIDPQDDPEVWIAMSRVFSNPTPKMNQESYFQVIDALEVIQKIEAAEDDPRADVEEDFLSNLPDVKEADEGEIKDDDFQISAVDEIEEKSKVRRSSAFRDPAPPRPKPKPPESTPWLRRWRNFNKVINVLGKPYKVQSVKNRWWRRK